MKPRIAQILRRVEQGILRQSCMRRDRKMTHVASDHDFEFSGSGASTESVMQERCGHSDKDADECYCDDNDHKSSAFHGFVSMLMDEGPGDQRRIIRR